MDTSHSDQEAPQGNITPDGGIPAKYLKFAAREHSHTWTHNGKTYDVLKLIEALKGRSTGKVAPQDLPAPARDSRSGFGKMRYAETDLQYPLIYDEGSMRVVDGRHRLAKALDTGVESLDYFPVDQDDLDAVEVGKTAAAVKGTPEEPKSPEQAEAGNYRKGHLRIQGLDITVENKRGQQRKGTDPSGKSWSITMKHHYGYIKRTESDADGDHIDVFIGPDQASELVFVVDQVNPSSNRFDEHKVLLGFTSEDAARKGYLANYEKGWKGLGDITALTMPQFKTWINTGDTGHRIAQTVKLASQGLQDGFWQGYMTKQA